MDLELLPKEKIIKLKKLLDAEKILSSRNDFLFFVKQVWPDFICRDTNEPSDWGHHQIIADKLNKVSEGKIKRLIINMPPRHTKSEFAS